MQKVKFFSKNRKAEEKFAKLGKKFFVESNFRERLWGILQKSNQIFVKIMFFFPKTNFHKKKFEKKFFANIFVMSAALSPWGKGFESRFLGKSEICGIFSVYLENCVFRPHNKWVLKKGS
jgi:hypothetical protein